VRRKLTKCGTAVIVRENDNGWIHMQNYWGPSIQCDSCLELYEDDPPSIDGGACCRTGSGVCLC